MATSEFRPWDFAVLCIAFRANWNSGTDKVRDLLTLPRNTDIELVCHGYATAAKYENGRKMRPFYVSGQPVIHAEQKMPKACYWTGVALLWGSK